CFRAIETERQPTIRAVGSCNRFRMERALHGTSQGKNSSSQSCPFATSLNEFHLAKVQKTLGSKELLDLLEQDFQNIMFQQIEFLALVTRKELVDLPALINLSSFHFQFDGNVLQIEFVEHPVFMDRGGPFTLQGLKKTQYKTGRFHLGRDFFYKGSCKFCLQVT